MKMMLCGMKILWNKAKGIWDKAKGGVNVKKNK